MPAAEEPGYSQSISTPTKPFSAITRSRTLPTPTDITTEIFEAARGLLAREKLSRPVRLIGTGISNFRHVQACLPLMPDPGRKRSQQLDQTMDRIRDKFGNKSIVRAEAAVSDSDATNDLLSQKNRTLNGQ